MAIGIEIKIARHPSPWNALFQEAGSFADRCIEKGCGIRGISGIQGPDRHVRVDVDVPGSDGFSLEFSQAGPFIKRDSPDGVAVIFCSRSDRDTCDGCYDVPRGGESDSERVAMAFLSDFRIEMMHRGVNVLPDLGMVALEGG